MAKWTREEIIRHILSRESSNLPLSLGGETPVEQSLYQAATRIFGTWRNAVMAAGITPNKAGADDRWPATRVVAAIRALSRRRRPPRAHELKKQYGSLVRAARRVFGSWSKAIAIAGVDPLKLRASPPWTKDRIIEAILMRALRNESLRSHSVRPKSLSSAGIRVFGSWGQALAAAGLDPKRYVPGCWATKNSGPYPTNESVLQAVQTRLQERRLINALAVYREDRPLYRTAQRLFGNWRNTLAAAGLNPQEFRGSRWRAPDG